MSNPLSRRQFAVVLLLNLLGLTAVYWLPRANSQATVRINTACAMPDAARADRITMLFNTQVVAQRRVGMVEQAPLFQISPPWPGKWTWAATDTLEYNLEEPLPPGRVFVVKATDALEKTSGKILKGQDTFRVETVPLKFSACEVVAADQEKLTLSVAFNQPVDPQAFWTHTDFYDNKRDTLLKDPVMLTQVPQTKMVVRVPYPSSGSLRMVIDKELVGYEAEVGLQDTVTYEQEVQLAFSLYRAYADFSFGPMNNEPLRALPETQAKLDKAGKARLSIQLPQTLEPCLYQLRLNATVTEPGGRSVSDNLSFALHRTHLHLGLALRPGNLVQSGQPTRVDWVRLTEQDELAPPGAMEVHLARVEYETVVSMIDDRPVWKSQEKAIVDVNTFEISADLGAVNHFSICCPDPGVYRLSLTDKTGRARTVLQFDAHDPVRNAWNSPTNSPEKLKISTDRPRYEPGATAKVRIQSPIRGTLLLTLETDHVATHQVHTLTGNIKELELTLPSDLLGSFFLCASVIRRVDPALKEWKPHRAMGTLQLAVNRDRHELPVEMTAPKTARPGQTESYAWGTAYAGLCLAAAAQAGYNVDEDFVSRLTAYLGKQLQNRAPEDIDLNTKAMICRVLVAFDQPPQGWMARLAEQEDQLDIEGRSHLALAFLMSGRQDKAKTLLPQALPPISAPTRTAGRLTSQIRQEAVLLSALLDVVPDAPLIPTLVSRLNKSRTRHHWGSTLNNSAVVAALAAYQAISDSEAQDYQGTLHIKDHDPIPFDHTQSIHRTWGGQPDLSRSALREQAHSICSSQPKVDWHRTMRWHLTARESKCNDAGSISMAMTSICHTSQWAIWCRWRSPSAL